MGRLSCLVDSVHPRACGEQFRFSPVRTSGTGSSPRLRGTVPPNLGYSSAQRFIPAPAGNRPQSRAMPKPAPVHPRACGEQDIRKARKGRHPGSSPRLRGTAFCSAPSRWFGFRMRFIPAPAGNSWRGKGEGAPPDGSSPRLRGTARCQPPTPTRRRFIPAPAGNSAYPVAQVCDGPVHPRACGEQPVSAPSQSD